MSSNFHPDGTLFIVSGPSGAGKTTLIDTVRQQLEPIGIQLTVDDLAQQTFDNKLFTGIFVFPALLGCLVIGGMILLFHVLHGEATAIHGDMTPRAEVVAPQ